MRRYFIVIGDKTTNGGVVLEGEERTKNHGKALSYHGARVYCPACKSEGHIVGDGPSRPMLLHGKQVALEDDLCICDCSPPPRLIRSQTNAFMSFEGHELTQSGYALDGRRLSEEARTRYIAFRLKDIGTLEGLDCIAHFDDGSFARGRFDRRNSVRFENPTGMACKKLTFSSHTRNEGSTFCAALVTTLTA
ncbi:PAAR domain-containing protein [Burkholderia ubonensis]|nr:PAAR domain-containing protein [Burkholderia ubonensis]